MQDFFCITHTREFVLPVCQLCLPPVCQLLPWILCMVLRKAVENGGPCHT